MFGTPNFKRYPHKLGMGLSQKSFKYIQISTTVLMMLKMMICSILVALFSVGCKSKENKILLPDLRPNFLELLHQRDSTLTLDSFYFVGIDTMNAKKALTHQRFAFLHIMEKIDGQLGRFSKVRDSMGSVPSASELEMMEYLKGEKIYVGKEIDSFNDMIVHADTSAPIGYRAFYKVTVRKKNQFIVSDTIPYSITLEMMVSDWDRNIEKSIDSLAVGRPGHRGGLK
jgi:hypothetical protein